MADSRGTFRYNITGEFDSKALKSMAKEFDGAAKKLDTTNSKWSSFAKSLGDIGSKMTNVGKSFTTGVTLPIIAGLGLATKAAIDEEKEMALLSQALEKNTGATKEQVDQIEKWVTKMQNATGVADGELRPALATLSRSTKDASEAQDLLSIALDIAAARGVPVETVAKAMAKAHDGNVGALGRLGIATKDAEGKTLNFKDVMGNAIKTYGGAAQTAADTTAGKFAVLKAKMADISEEIGRTFMPTLEKLMEQFEKVMDKIAEMDPRTRDTVVKVALAVAGFGPVLIVLGKLASAISAVIKAFKLLQAVNLLAWVTRLGKWFDSIITMAGTKGALAGTAWQTGFIAGAAALVGFGTYQAGKASGESKSAAEARAEAARKGSATGPRATWRSVTRQSGGPIPSTGWYYAHEGEYVLRKSAVERLNAGAAGPSLTFNITGSREDANAIRDVVTAVLRQRLSPAVGM